MATDALQDPTPPDRAPLDMDEAGAFAEQVLGVLTGGATTAMMMIGDRLGLYEALAELGPATSERLAEKTGTHERYVREWLAQQSAVGFATFDAMTQTFALPAEHAAVLAGDASPMALVGCAPLITGMHRRVDELVAAFRTGAGVPWGDQDDTIFETTERFFRQGYRASLLQEWIPAMDPRVGERLAGGALVADVGCGHGAALIMLAEAFPRSRFVGYDAHAPSITTARERAGTAGVADRVAFQVSHCQGYPQRGYDLITFFDAFHDLGDPAGAATYAREALAEAGTLMLVEPLAADDLATNLATNPGAGLNYAASTFLCTPNSLSQPVGLGLGAQAGERRLGEVLASAGFSGVRRVAESPLSMVIEARP